MVRNTLFTLLLLFVPLVSCSKSNDVLLKEIQSDDRTVRLNAAMKLNVQTKDPATIASMVAMLDTADDRTKLIVTQILGTTADSSLVEPLSRMVYHPNAAIRDCAVRSIGALGAKSAAPHLIKALGDSSSDVRYSAVRMLGNIKSPEAVPSLFPLFRDQVDSVRAVTVQTLYLYRVNRWAPINASDFLVPMSDRSDLVRYATAQALGIPYPDSTLAGDLLVQTLSDPNKFVRLKAIISLRQLRYERSVPYLKSMYDFATVEEELEITDTIKAITGETYPPDEPAMK